MYNAIRETIRQIWRGRSRAAAIVGVMALGIGSCVAVFSMIGAVLFAGWPYAEVDRLVIIWHARQNAPGVIGMSPGDVESYRASMRTVDRIGAVTTRGYNAGGTAPFRVTCGRMSPEMFPLLGVPAQRGRWFSAEEDVRREHVVVISEHLWRAQLGAEPEYPGRNLMLDAIPHRVVGVMPSSFVFPPEGVQGLSPADCWVPASYSNAELAAPAFNFVTFGRLAPGISLSQAAEDANVGAHRIWSSYPAAVQSQIALEARVVPVTEQVLGSSRTPLFAFAGAALLLLLIGCSNVTNFLLTALDTRRRELALRSSLGASRTRLVGQLLLESMTLSIGGGIAGWLLAAALIAAIVAVNANAFPRLANTRVDVAALMFAIACSAMAGLIGGLAPALRLRSSSLGVDRIGSRDFSRQWWRRGLIAFEISLAVLVLVFAAAIGRSVLQLNAVDPGFSPDRLLTFSVSVAAAQYARPEQTTTFAEQVVRGLAETPGITVAASGSALPVGPAAAAVLAPVGDGASQPKYQPAALTAVTAGYVRAAGLTLRHGRFVEPHDGATSQRVAVINETLARTLWPSEDAVGRAVISVGSQSPLTIVGVVADVRQGGPLRPAAPALYVPLAQSAQPVATLNFVVRSEMSPERIASRAREIVGGIDPTLPTFALRTGGDLIAATIAVHRFNLLVLGLFATVAIVLALAGVYGVLSHFIEQSRRGFGIRQALGATHTRIAATVVGWAMTPVLIGAVAGGAVASAAVTLIASQLFGVSAAGPSTLAAVVLLVAVFAIAMVLPPALRASRADVATALRLD